MLIHDLNFSATTDPERMEEGVVEEVAILVVALTTFASDLVAGGISWWHLLVAFAGGFDNIC